MQLKLYKKVNRKPLIYLISPPKIDIKTFPSNLIRVLDTGMVSIFQLRLKNYKDIELEKITNLLFEICNKKKVTFILNDRVDIAKKLNVDGVHVGKNDISIKKARKILGYETKVTLDKSIDKVIDHIKKNGTKKFVYNYELEIDNEKTPGSWKEKLF